MKIKKWTKKILNTLGYEIHGYHTLGLINEPKGKVVEILGYQGKTTLKNKIVKYQKLISEKASLIDDDEIQNKLKIPNDLNTLIINEINKSNIELKKKIRRSKYYFDYLGIYNKYLFKNSIITHEGIIKQYFNEFYNLLEMKNIDFSFLNNFAFIILKNEFEETYRRAKIRYGWNKIENREKFKQDYDKYYEMMDKFIFFLESKKISHLVYSNHKKDDLELIMNFIKSHLENSL